MNNVAKTGHRSLTEIVPDAPNKPDAFLAWTATLGAEYNGDKFELSKGLVTRSGGHRSRGHSSICTNIKRAFFDVLDLDRYVVLRPNFSVKTPVSVRCPDILVERSGGNPRDLATERPIFIAEVLSPSTTAVDFLEELPEYISIPSLQTYLICSQDEAIVWVMTWQVGGGWPSLPQQVAGFSASVEVPGLRISLPMSEIYRGIPEPGL